MKYTVPTGEQNSPPPEEGWPRHQSNVAKPPFKERPGWSLTRHLALFAVVLYIFVSTCLFAATGDVADAAMKKNAAAVRTLIQQKANVNAPQPDGTTALHWAARWDDVELA